MAISAAETIVIRHGYHHLNARRVAIEIGYTVGTLYLLFQNFDDLILQVNGRTLDALNQALEKEMRYKADIKALALAYLRFAESHVNQWKLLYEYHPQTSQRPDWYREKIERLFSLVEAVLRNEGSDITPDHYRISALALWGAIHGICSLKMDERLQLAGDLPVEEVVSFLIVRFLRGN